MGRDRASDNARFAEKERKLMDKVKTLKMENKKLMQLLKDSEKLFT